MPLLGSCSAAILVGVSLICVLALGIGASSALYLTFETRFRGQ